MHLIPLALALPLAGAGVLVLLSRPPLARLANVVAVGVGVATAAVCGYVFDKVLHGGMLVYWFGAWNPATHVGIGIDFAVDATGAAAALLAAVIATLVILYSVEYYKDSGPLFNVLLLVFMGAACACFYTGDLFDLFVFFELSNIATFALAAYKVQDETALDGALVFVIMNSIAAFAILFGLTLLEGYTDQLNLATIGQYLSVHPMQAVAVAAFALATCGFFLRSALVPFHFWFADAQSSAPSPVCALFSAITVEIGLYAFARVYWAVFSGVFHPGDVLRDVFIGFGSFSAFSGAILAFGAHHLKRLVAYVTVSHIGVALVAVGLFNAQGMAAALLYMLAFSLSVSALILCVGAIVHMYGKADEVGLWGRGRRMPFVMVLFLISSLDAAGLPAIGTYVGRAMLLSVPSSGTLVWIAAVTLFTASVTGGALLKAVGAVWLGLGEPDPELTHAKKSQEKRSEEESDQPESRELGWHLLLPPAILCAAASVVPMLPQTRSIASRAAMEFVDRAHYYAMTVYGHATAVSATVPNTPDFAASTVWGVLALIACCLLALASLYQRRMGRLHSLAVALSKPIEMFERLHDGQVGDYVTWFVLGSALLGGLLFVSYK